MSSPPFNEDRAAPRGFMTTRWSLVLAAGRATDPETRAALATLCQWYWQPLYEFARRRGASAVDAADLTQGFFSVLLEKDYLQSANQEQGRFRTFLLTAFKRFLLNERDRADSLKRGGHVQIFSINTEAAESGIRFEPSDETTAEKIFERRWAITMLDRVLSRLEQQMRERDRGQLFELCRSCLTGLGSDDSYAAIATHCGLTEAAVKIAVHRMRSRFRELLLEEVRLTVASEAEAMEELQSLLRAVQT